jgi:DNA-binding response OmpR family regulator
LILATNGKEGIDLTIKHNPDLIVMDIQLPDMNGNEIIQELRKRKYKGSIIAVSADTDEKDVVKSLQAGADDYTTKPIDFDAFFGKIKGLLSKSAGKRKAAKPTTKKDIKKEVYKIDPSISDEARNIFIADTKEKITIINYALASDAFKQQMDKIKAIAHEYKGTAPYFGLNELETEAIKLDKAFKDKETIQQLKKRTERLHSILQAIIDGNT